MSKNFYVTTPIYYVNAKPHLGHIYTTVLADALARHSRRLGRRTFFLTGTDEHGQNIERAAEKNGLPVKSHVDVIVREFQQAFAAFGLKPNHWIRTTDAYHERGAQELWRRVQGNGFIYKGAYEGWYCPNCNEFKDETTPGEAPICEIHLRQTERVAEESYFFKLSEFQKPLLEFYDRHPDFIQPEARRNEVVSFVSGGLKDLSVSRISVKWGIPVPDDPKHTMYVWFDALSNYITALGFGNSEREGFDAFWPASTHLVGKDILRFHAVYWPAFLMAAGIAPPNKVFAHGMWLSGGRKMSKSLGNVIDLNVLRRHFTRDQVRYFCLREMAYGQDGDFTYAALIDRVNGDLASGLGNLASRTLTMIRNYFGGELPNVPSDAPPDAIAAAAAIAARFAEAERRFCADFERAATARALEIAFEMIAMLDKYLSDAVPWKLAKDEANRARLATVLHTATEGVRHVVALLSPCMPEATEAIWRQMGLPGSADAVNPATLAWERFPGEIKITEIHAIFPRLEKEKIMSEIEKTAVVSSPEPPPAPDAPASETAEEKGYITIDDFVKVELRVAQVLEAERVPKADKLLRLQVDAGEASPRQILAGIAQYYEPETLIGRKIVIVANLAPRKLRGFESNGMLLAASVGDQGKPVIATFAEDVPNGARLK
jgi:methionyl-tRNA synthetase